MHHTSIIPTSLLEARLLFFYFQNIFIRTVNRKQIPKHSDVINISWNKLYFFTFPLFESLSLTALKNMFYENQGVLRFCQFIIIFSNFPASLLFNCLTTRLKGELIFVPAFSTKLVTSNRIKTLKIFISFIFMTQD